jgi:hypothetical protein
MTRLTPLRSANLIISVIVRLDCSKPELRELTPASMTVAKEELELDVATVACF